MTRKLSLTLLLSSFAFSQVRYEDIVKGPGADWLTYSGNYNGSRYSPLKQITPENVGSMVVKWVFHVPKASALRTSPIVYKGIMYVTNTNAIYAIDARSGRQIWEYVDTRSKKDGANRGAAILGDRVFFTTADNYLTALDRRTGGLLFAKQFGDPKKGTTSTSAPMVVKDKILVGSSGGDSGMRGFITALSPEDGHEIWRTWTVPVKGEPGAESWGDLIEWGGGATWLSGTYDPETNTIFWPTGNPWPDFSGAPRGGDNLYTCSLLALDLDRGKVKWHFQFTPHDTHDWDAQSWPLLVDIPWNGKPRKVVLHANRNGFFYMLDRNTGEFLRATQLVDKMNWAKGVDDKGRPMVIPGTEPTLAGNVICPSVKGATNWMGQSYNPGTGLLYVLTLEQCGVYTTSAQKPMPMKNFAGGGAAQDRGEVILRAIDPGTGKRVWEFPMTGDTGMWAGVVSTATGVVFSGDDDNHLIALDARKGKHLWHFNMGEPLTASPIVYEVDGKEQVAIASATSIFSFGLFEPQQKADLPKLTQLK